MKKRILNRVLTLGLSVIMAVSMCGCVKDGYVNEIGGDGGKDSGKGNVANAALAKEYVYRADYIDLPEMGDNSYVIQTLIKDDRLMLLVNESTWNEETYVEDIKYTMISTNLDGGDLKSFELELPDESGEAADAIGDEYDAYNRKSYFGNFFVGNDNALYGLKTLSESWSSADGNWTNRQSYFLCSWDTNGKLMTESAMEFIEFDPESWSYISQMFECADGKIRVFVNGQQSTIYTMDKSGKLLDEGKMQDELTAILSNNERLIPLQNGNLFIVYHPETDWSKTFCAEFDVATGKLGEAKEIPSSIMMSWDYNYMNVGIDSDLIFTTSSGISTYNMGDAEPVRRMDYVNSDIFVSSINSLVEVDSDHFVAVFRENNDSRMKAAKFTYVKPEDIQDKSVVVIAGQWFDYEMKQRVIDFNRASQDTRIVMKDYSQYNTYDDYTAGQTKLNNEIITGNMPDILVSSEYNPLPIENYISKGLIADIGKLIAEDPELSKTEFVQNVFDAYKVNGTLYYVVPQFQVNTYLAKQSLVGDRTSWTMKEMQQVLAGMGSEAQAFGDMTRENFLYTAMRFCGSQFVDAAEGTCDFTSQSFMDILEYAKTLPETIEYDDDYWNNYDWSMQEAQYRENKTLLMQTSISYFSELARSINGYFGEPVSFIGFPTEAGMGSYLQSGTLYALSAKSENLDKAWQFIRYYLCDEYQSKLDYMIPVNKKYMLEYSKTALDRPFWTDEDGNKQYYDIEMTINGENVKIDPLNQQQLDEVLEFIESVDRRFFNNEFITNIVTEECGAFFSGQKSAADVAKIIQNRVQNYVDENY